MNEILNHIWNAREQRAALRKRIAAQGSGALSLSLNIPGVPKTNPLFAEFFQEVLRSLKRFLTAHRIFIEVRYELCIRDEAGDFYLAPLCVNNPSIISIKTLCETFEAEQPLGRLIDVDLLDAHLQPVSSQKLKPCYLCQDTPAIVCMRENAHSYEELRAFIASDIAQYLHAKRQERVCRALATIALKAVLYEISVSPKPGLVDRSDQGSHGDMDYFTFINSTASIAGYFYDLTLSGYMFNAGDLTKALPIIRETGLKMEAAMFVATGGVNTQKGLIFLIGLALFASAYLIARDGYFDAPTCREIISQITKDIVRNELGEIGDGDQTHGQVCFQKYGAKYGGVRQEAEDGLPTVFHDGLGELKRQLAGIGKELNVRLMNEALIYTLLRIMTVANDTNILYRKDIDTLNTVKTMARHVLETADIKEQRKKYTELIDYCKRKYISPGGSADLLAVTIFFYFVESAFPRKR